ncbi:hypothetical protein ACMD2_20595 [Ananas comosus]|uniref:Uncharacterized protein n=1 Tax=Ananas comosus TaxID=4615 RepID=A0A199UEN0_ANACO|nr:hypothetical protein ACMD2_20595 [Ananas comosus]
MSSGDPIDHLGPRNVLHLPRPLFDLLLRSNFEDLSDFEVIEPIELNCDFPI